MVTPKLGVPSILCWNFIIQKREYSERVDRIPLIAFGPLRVFALCKLKHLHCSRKSVVIFQNSQNHEIYTMQVRFWIKISNDLAYTRVPKDFAFLGVLQTPIKTTSKNIFLLLLFFHCISKIVANCC